MSKLADILFEGSSFTKYKFGAYPADSDFSDEGAVYILTRRTKPGPSGGTHVITFIGSAEKLAQKMDSEGPDFASRHQANCICVLYESDPEIRASIERDLLKNHLTPFNQK